MASTLVQRSSTVLVAAACLLAGCSASQGGDTPPSGAPTSGPAKQAAPNPTSTFVDTKGGVGARADLKKVTCKADSAGAWSITGEIVNPTKTTQTYTVDASVVNPDGWTVQGDTSTDVEVKAGQKGAVDVKNFFKSSASDAKKFQCVTRVVRHPAS